MEAERWDATEIYVRLLKLKTPGTESSQNSRRSRRLVESYRRLPL